MSKPPLHRGESTPSPRQLLLSPRRCHPLREAKPSSHLGSLTPAGRHWQARTLTASPCDQGRVTLAGRLRHIDMKRQSAPHHGCFNPSPWMPQPHTMAKPNPHEDLRILRWRRCLHLALGEASNGHIHRKWRPYSRCMAFQIHCLPSNDHYRQVAYSSGILLSKLSG